jgi:hypothetical protein
MCLHSFERNVYWSVNQEYFYNNASLEITVENFIILLDDLLWSRNRDQWEIIVIYGIVLEIRIGVDSCSQTQNITLSELFRNPIEKNHRNIGKHLYMTAHLPALEQTHQSKVAGLH